MKKNRLLCYLPLCYELVRLVAILLTRPEFSIDMLPASWYASAPLMAFTPILAYLMATQDDATKSSTYSRLYIMAKLLSGAGLVAYCLDAVPLSIAYGQLNGYYSIKRALFLMIFFLIDVILCAVVFMRLRREKDRTEKPPVPGTPDDGENEQCR